MFEWIWKLCNMAFQNDVVDKDWRSAMTVSLYKVKWKRTECENYGGIGLFKRGWKNLHRNTIY